MNIPGLVKELLLTILLLLLSKITVDLVKNLDLVKFFLLTKNFTKWGLYCTYIRQQILPLLLEYTSMDHFIEMRKSYTKVSWKIQDKLKHDVSNGVDSSLEIQ